MKENSPELPRINKTQLMRDVEAMFFGRDIRLVLVDLLNSLGSVKAVARRLGLSRETIHQWLDALGVEYVEKVEARLVDVRRKDL